MLDFCPAELVVKACQDFDLLDSGQTILDREIVFAGRTLLVAASPIGRDGDASGSAISVALTGISKQKKLETALAAANDNLFAAYKEIRIFAKTDALTGLVNRFGLENSSSGKSAVTVASCIRSPSRWSMWTALNPTTTDMAMLPPTKAEGHRQHYSVCGATPWRLRGTHWGSDGFVVVLPNTTLAGAEHVARVIQSAAADLAIRQVMGYFLD